MLLCLALTGNVITLLVICKGNAFRTVGQGRLFLTNLAFVDLLGSIECLVSAIGYINPECIIKNKIFREFNGGYRWFVRYMMTTSLLMLSINRYVAARIPLKINSIFSKRNSCIFILANLLFYILMPLLIKLADQRPVSFKPFEGSCLLQTTQKSAIAIMVCTFLPLTATTGYCNLAIFKVVKRQSNRVTTNLTGRSEVVMLDH